MSSNTVAQFAVELKMPAEVLLEQLRSAGVEVKSVDDAVTDAGKAKLLESLRRAHGGSEGQKITLTRRQTSEIRQADGSGRSRTIQVEVRKKLVFVKRDPSELVAEAAKSASVEPAQAPGQSPVDAQAQSSTVPPQVQTPQELPTAQTAAVSSSDASPSAAANGVDDAVSKADTGSAVDAAPGVLEQTTDTAAGDDSSHAAAKAGVEDAAVSAVPGSGSAENSPSHQTPSDEAPIGSAATPADEIDVASEVAPA